MSHLVTIDFETDGIEPMPDYPPKPVGVAIKDGRRNEYLSWGHPCDNNTTRSEGRRRLMALHRDPGVVPIYHNASFDICVGMEHLDLPMPVEFHDTLFLAFLFNPYEPNLSLKPMAEKYLGEPPTEQDILRDWIVNNVREATLKNWGTHIAKAPGVLVGRYARGDTKRTDGLFKYLHPRVISAGMGAAYDLERVLLPVVLGMEARGVPVHEGRLRRAVRTWRGEVARLERAIYRRLGVGAFNLDSGNELADALEEGGAVEEWILTDTGKRSTSKENLEEVMLDARLKRMIRRRTVFQDAVTKFAEPWLRRAERSGGILYPRFHQVRGRDERSQGQRGGARTGRFSSSDPNFQNLTNNPEKEIIKALRVFRDDLALPVLRDYIVPPEGCCFIKRDYSQQEFRILAHFEGGELMRQYLADPKLDVHVLAGELIQNTTGLVMGRKPVKIIGFGNIYAMGVGKTAVKIGLDIETTRRFRNAYWATFPGVKELNRDLKAMGRRGEPIRTWLGRLYDVEEPKKINGEWRTFEYKLLNYLIQGSAAEATKTAMVNVDQVCHSSIAIQVHDELINIAELGSERREMRRMKEAMEAVRFNIPMLTDGFWSRRSWAEMKECNW